MLKSSRHVELTQDELALIASALETQEKILSVQSRAGGRTAGASLADLKDLIKRIRAHGPRKTGSTGFLTRLRGILPCGHSHAI